MFCENYLCTHFSSVYGQKNIDISQNIFFSFYIICKTSNSEQESCLKMKLGPARSHIPSYHFTGFSSREALHFYSKWLFCKMQQGTSYDTHSPIKLGCSGQHLSAAWSFSQTVSWELECSKQRSFVSALETQWSVQISQSWTLRAARLMPRWQRWDWFDSHIRVFQVTCRLVSRFGPVLTCL